MVQIAQAIHEKSLRRGKFSARVNKSTVATSIIAHVIYAADTSSWTSAHLDTTHFSSSRSSLARAAQHSDSAAPPTTLDGPENSHLQRNSNAEVIEVHLATELPPLQCAHVNKTEIEHQEAVQHMRS